METRDKFGRFIKGIKLGPRTKEVKQAISKANSGSGNGMWKGGKPHCKICDIEIWWGSVYCNKHLKRMWLSSPSLETREKMSISSKIRFENEKNHPRWKGENAGYISIHKWIRKHKGNPNHCKLCGSIEKRRYEWAQIKGKNGRNLDNWFSLCVPCHRKYDDIGNKIWITRRKNDKERKLYANK